MRLGEQCFPKDPRQKPFYLLKNTVISLKRNIAAMIVWKQFWWLGRPLLWKTMSVTLLWSCSTSSMVCWLSLISCNLFPRIFKLGQVLALVLLSDRVHFPARRGVKYLSNFSWLLYLSIIFADLKSNTFIHVYRKIIIFFLQFYLQSKIVSLYFPLL